MPKNIIDEDIVNNPVINGSIVPSANAEFNIGSSFAQFLNEYLAGTLTFQPGRTGNMLSITATPPSNG